MDTLVRKMPETILEFEGNASPLMQPPRMKTVLGFGSCYIEHMLAGLNHVVEYKHLWRATIPSLASSRLKLRSRVLAFKDASDFFTRETEKQLFDLLRESDADAFLFDVAGDFTTAHISIGDTVFPDLRNGVFKENWGEITYDEILELKGHRLLTADLDYYWDLWKFYFDKLYSNVLHKKIMAGQKVLFLCHYLSEAMLDKGEPKAFEHFNGIRRRNATLEEIYDFISKYQGVIQIKVSEDISYSALSSPFDGPWEFHPDLEFYCIARRNLLNELFTGDDVAERYLIEWLAENGRARARAQTALESLTRETEALRSQLAEALRIAEEYAAETRRLEGERAAERAAAEYAAGETARVEGERAAERAAAEYAAEEAARVEGALREELLRLFPPSARARDESDDSFIVGAARRLMSKRAMMREAERLRRANFDGTAYLSFYPDVAAAGVEPIFHYVACGRKEGRTAFFRG